MKKYLEKSGKTEDEALAAALKELGLERDDVSVEIVERAKSGFLGIGASPAVIRVEYEVPDAPEVKPEPVHEAPRPAVKAEAPAAPKYTEGVKAVLAENPKTFDPKAYGKEARQRVIALVMERMLVCGCDGKA